MALSMLDKESPPEWVFNRETLPSGPKFHSNQSTKMGHYGEEEDACDLWEDEESTENDDEWKLEVDRRL